MGEKPEHKVCPDYEAAMREMTGTISNLRSDLAKKTMECAVAQQKTSGLRVELDRAENGLDNASLLVTDLRADLSEAQNELIATQAFCDLLSANQEPREKPADPNPGVPTETVEDLENNRARKLLNLEEEVPPDTSEGDSTEFGANSPVTGGEASPLHPAGKPINNFENPLADG